jgi:hypothetical protein
MNKNVILVDFNNLAVRHYLSSAVAGYTPAPDLPLWRYTTFDSIFKSILKIGNVKEVVLAVDDNISWRKSYFSRYKESRKKNRDKTDINWPLLYSEMHKLSTDIKENLPFKVIRIKNAEADDVIGVIALEGGNYYVVISNDEDYLQLYSKYVRIWNPKDKKFKVCNDTERFIVEKCLMGQSKDDIFNVKTPSDWPEGKRKPGFGPKMTEKVMEKGYENWLRENGLEYNFNRNRVLMDFKKIPKTISSRIKKEYYEYEYPNPDEIYKFFSRNKFRSYLDEFTKIENILLQLY